MTQKELLYVEDAVTHEQNIIAICDDMVNNLSDDSLIEFVKDEQKKHKSLEKKLTKMLEDKSNE